MPVKVEDFGELQACYQAMPMVKRAEASGYLSIIQVVLGEMVRLDGKNASHYAKTTAQIRRCSTILSDCETASDIAKAIF